jgi:hypothetical protein
VRRVLQIVILYAVLAQATGVAWALTEDANGAQCSDDDDGTGDRDQCPPNCPSCDCSTVVHATFAEPVVMLAFELPTIRVAFVEPNEAQPSPDPRDILHVPRTPRV